MWLSLQAKELGIEVYWNDWRSMCAFTYVKLGNLIDSNQAGMVLHMEPQGDLFAEANVFLWLSIFFSE